MQLIAGEVALSRCDGAYAAAQRFNEDGRTAAGRGSFAGNLCFNGLPYENGFGYATTPGQLGEATVKPDWKFAGQYAHTKKGNTSSALRQYPSYHSRIQPRTNNHWRTSRSSSRLVIARRLPGKPLNCGMAKTSCKSRSCRHNSSKPSVVAWTPDPAEPLAPGLATRTRAVLCAARRLCYRNG